METAGFFFTSDSGFFPSKSSPKSAGFDLAAAETSIIPAGLRKWVDTGIGLVLPDGVYGRVAPRSGLAGKGIDIGAGVIDQDYQGTIKILVINNTPSMKDFTVQRGELIAQVILTKILDIDQLDWKPKPSIATERGTQGFGSTEKRN